MEFSDTIHFKQRTNHMKRVSKNAAPLQRSDDYSSQDLAPVTDPGTAMGGEVRDAVSQIMGKMMGRLQPILDKQKRGIDSSRPPRAPLIDIDVSPKFDIGVKTDLGDAFYHNNAAIATGNVQ